MAMGVSFVPRTSFDVACVVSCKPRHVDVGIASKTGASDGGPRLGSPTDARDMPCKFSMRVLLASCVVQMWMWTDGALA